MTVLNRPGAAQTIAISYLAQKKGDGNEIGLASGSFINAIARNGSQLHKQFTPLIKLFDAYQAYFTAVDLPIKSMAEVRDRLKADPSAPPSRSRSGSAARCMFPSSMSARRPARRRTS